MKDPTSHGTKVFYLFHRLPPIPYADVDLHVSLGEPSRRGTPTMFATAPAVRLIGGNKHDLSQRLQRGILRQAVRLSGTLPRELEMSC